MQRESNLTFMLLRMYYLKKKFVYPFCVNCTPSNIFPLNCFTIGQTSPTVAYNVANADIVVTDAPQAVTNDLEINFEPETLPPNTAGSITDVDSHSLPPPSPYHQTEL